MNEVISILWVGIGGAVGSILRYTIGRIAQCIGIGNTLWSTFLVNVFGSFLLGYFTGLLSRPHQASAWHPLLIVGLCGGFTTFSTFSMDAFRLYQSGKWMEAIAYTFASLLLSLIGVSLGLRLGLQGQG